MLQRLAIVLVQVKTGNASRNLRNKIGKIIFSWYRAKEISKEI